MTTLTPPKRQRRPHLLGDLADFRSDPLGLLLEIAHKHGPVTQLRFGPVPVYVLTDPAAAHYILQSNNRNYRKEQNFMNITRLALQTRDNLFTSDGELWLKQRRLMQPAFHRQQVARFGEVITAETTKALAHWQAGHPLDVEAAMMDITMSIIGRTMLNVDILRDHRQLYHAFTTISTYVADRSANLAAPLVYALNGRHRAFHQALQITHSTLRTAIAERIQQGDHPGDLLDMLMAAREEGDGGPMSTAKLMDELFGIVSAGHETSSVTLAWLFHSLATYPAVAARVHQELTSVLGERLPTVADLPQLPYLRTVIDEALRRYPAAFVTTRQSIEADDVVGYAIPAKSILLVNIYGLHHHPRYWAEPMSFIPERFTPEQAQANNRSAYLPFLIGPRKCIGEPLALLEMQLITATIAQRFRLQTDPTRPAKLTAKFTLRAQGGMWLTPETHLPYPSSAPHKPVASATA
ncbi:MAG: cytochrome P450 [Caldilineaceae bacterium]|nr:cytochrome P450 [Caldilineaceae bacterium]